MKIILNSRDLKKELKNKDNLGFVPTMGSLHDGHKSLIQKSKKKSKKTIVSIFINPKQFNNKKDLSSYPRDINNDLSILRTLKVDYVFIPKIKDIYKFKRERKIKLKRDDLILCAKYRKGHFEGVLDVMDRLTKLITPKRIYMGEKDFQQLYLVKKYLEPKYKTKIINCSTIRAMNKVALSSRNFLLNSNQLTIAGKVTKNLIIFKKKLVNQKKTINNLSLIKKNLTKKFGIKIEYMEIRNTNNFNKSTSIKNSRLFIAYYLNKVRLIDNL